MIRTVLCTFRARQDLIDLAAWIAADNPDATRRFIDAARATAEDLSDQPERGTPRAFASPALAGIRMSAVKGFRRHLMFYRPDDSHILIVRVLHGSLGDNRVMGEDN